MDRYLPAALIGACGVSATAFLGRLLRPRFPIRVNCWFCNQNSIVPYGNRNCWDCPNCDQYNGFDEEGNYNKAIPAQFSESLNSLKGCSSAQQQPQHEPYQQRESNFCADCNRNQLIKIKQLAAFVPVSADHFDEEVDLFKKRLDVSLALCGSCQAKAELVIEQQNRSLMYNIAEDAIIKTKQRRLGIDITPTADISTKRRRLFRRAAKSLNVLLVGIGFLLAASFYFRHFDQIKARWPSAPILRIDYLPHWVMPVRSIVETRPLIFIFSGVFLSLISVSLKNEASVDAGYSDLIVVLAWLSWLVVRLVLDHALHLPSQASWPTGGTTTTNRTSWISSRLEHLVYPTIVILSFVASLLNCLLGIFQKSRSWRSARKLSTTTMTSGLGPNSVLNTTSPLHSSSPRYVNLAYAQITPEKDFHSKNPSLSGNSTNAIPPTTDPAYHPPPTSTPPPPTSRPPSPHGSIVGQGIELKMGDIAGMTLSTGLTPKKKSHLRRSDGMFPSGGGGGASVWGNMGLNSSISSSGSSLENKKAKAIISPARFTGSQSRNPLPSALFGSTPNRPLISPSSSRPSSPLGWGVSGAGGGGGSIVGGIGGGGGGSVINGGLDSFGNRNFLADDALSTVSAPSRFGVPSGGGGSGGSGLSGVIGGGGGLGGLFSSFSPLNSQATTPRGSDNTSTSDRLDWPPPSQPPTNGAVDGLSSGNQRNVGLPRNGGVGTTGAAVGNQVIDDTFTDDSDSEESRCLADATMENVDRAMKPTAKDRRRRKRGLGEGGRGVAEDGGYFMKVVAVVSVVANVVLAFYLGTMMKS